MQTLRMMLIATTGLAATGVIASPRVEAIVHDASVERSADNRAVVLWRAVPNDAAIDVFVDGRLISNDDRDGRHELTRAEAARRPLVRLETQNGQDFVTSERVLPLAGGRNFRDLGGYPTSDGRTVRWGKVFRSGTMSRLTDEDYALLSTLGIRVVCDFRANEERDREPTLWKASGKPIQYHTRDYRTESSLLSIFSEGTPTAHSVRNAMMQLYGELAYEHADSYRTMFKSLASGEIPLAFNCSAGKDRTGLGAALLLTLLGVPRDTVVADYALSERVVNFEAEYATETKPKVDSKPDPYAFLAQLPPDVRAPLLRSDPAYIRSALEHIERKEGSIDAYFDRVLGISPAERARIRELLLDSPS